MQTARREKEIMGFLAKIKCRKGWSTWWMMVTVRSGQKIGE